MHLRWPEVAEAQVSMALVITCCAVLTLGLCTCRGHLQWSLNTIAIKLIKRSLSEWTGGDGVPCSRDDVGSTCRETTDGDEVLCCVDGDTSSTCHVFAVQQ